MSLVFVMFASGAQAKQPREIPVVSFAVKVPKDWTSRAPGRWVTSDGRISLNWDEVDLGEAAPLDWVKQCYAKLAREYRSQVRQIELAGGPAWTADCSFQGRLHRVCWTARKGRGVTIVCSYLPTQSFAAAQVMQETLKSFRWLNP